MNSADDRTRLRAGIDHAVTTLAEAGVASPRVDATALAAYALGVSQLVLAMPPPLPSGFDAEYAELVERRRLREPLQQIVGFAVFRHVTLRVEPGVFVPRPETEVVAGAAVAEAASITEHRPLVVDLGSGTGAIAASVDVEVPGVRVIAVEVDPAAATLTRANLATVASDSARVVQSDVADPGLLADLDGTVDVVVSNPPYIPSDEVPEDPEVRVHDPARALYGGGADGLDVPRAVARAAARLLRRGGLFVMEHGDAQGPAVRELVDAVGGFDEIRTHLDLTDRDRYVTARRTR